MRVVSLEITGSGYSDMEQDPGGFSRASTGVGGVMHQLNFNQTFAPDLQRDHRDWLEEESNLGWFDLQAIASNCLQKIFN